MKQLTTKLLLSITTIALIYLTSCNGAGEEPFELETPVVNWSALPYTGKPGAVVTLEGENLNSSHKFEIIVNKEYTVEPSELEGNSLSFTVPTDFSSGPMEVFANGEPILTSYFRFLNEKEKTLLSQANVAAYDFSDPNNGIYLDHNDVLYKTSDGGNSWAEIGHGAYENVIYAVSEQKIWKRKDHKRLEKTEDGGKSWEEVLILDNMLIDHYYASAEIVIVIATLRAENVTRLYTSTDNGESWEIGLTSEDPVFSRLRSHKVVYQQEDQIALLDIFNRSVIKTTDSKQWEKSNFGGFPNIGLKEKGVFFLSTELIWYASFDGLAQSKDGGLSYSNFEFPLTEYSDLIGRVHFYNELEGVAVSSDGGIIRTRDGGQTWRFNHIDGDVLEADFLDEDKSMILIQDKVFEGRKMMKLQF